jgi:hypothetical protein
MKYMFLIYTPESKETQMTGAELAEIMAGHMAVMEAMTKAGILHGSAPLKPTSMATTVRIQNGKPLVTDGPFAETKEQLGGYYIIDCKDLDEAISWASKIPTKCGGGGYGCIEVRPIQDVAEIKEMVEAKLAAQHA